MLRPQNQVRPLDFAPVMRVVTPALAKYAHRNTNGLRCDSQACSHPDFNGKRKEGLTLVCGHVFHKNCIITHARAYEQNFCQYDVDRRTLRSGHLGHRDWSSPRKIILRGFLPAQATVSCAIWKRTTFYTRSIPTIHCTAAIPGTMFSLPPLVPDVFLSCSLFLLFFVVDSP